VLTIPTGLTCTFKTWGAGSWFAKGIRKLTVSGYGATLSDNNGAGGFWLAGIGQYQDDKHSARLETVSAGSSSVKLKNLIQSSLFTVGRWALITGYDLQGYGFPTNPHYFEYVQIAVKDPSTGVITFASPLKNTYKSTWPHYSSGGAYEPDHGGPATLYALDPSWDTEVEYQGLTISRPNAQTYANGRSVTYRDVTFTGTGSGIPTQNMLWQCINCTIANADMEADKLVSSMVVTGSTIKTILFQSSSIDLFTMDRSTITGYLLGTPKKAVISNSTIKALLPGAFVYGRSDELVCTDCIIGSMPLGGNRYTGPSGAGIDTNFTMSGGVITIPMTGNSAVDAMAASWAVPSTNVVWQDADRTSISMFQVVDVIRDANNTYVKTNQSGGFPPYNHANNGILSLRTHPAPKITFTNSSATAPAGTNDGSDAYYLSQAPARAPLYSYSKRTYDGSVVNVSGTHLWGNLVSLKMNVTKAYSGPDSRVAIQPLGWYDWTTKPSDLSLYGYVPTINLKFAGERAVIISGSNQTITGVQSGDTVPSLPEVPLWWANRVWGHMMNDISSENPSYRPLITVEVITDQGIINR
jgi:hypothetical protein